MVIFEVCAANVKRERAKKGERLNQRSSLQHKEVKNLVGPVGKAAVVHHHREKKDDKKNNDVIEHKGAAVVAHRRRK